MSCLNLQPTWVVSPPQVLPLPFANQQHPPKCSQPRFVAHETFALFLAAFSNYHIEKLAFNPHQKLYTNYLKNQNHPPLFHNTLPTTSNNISSFAKSHFVLTGLKCMYCNFCTATLRLYISILNESRCHIS